MGGAPDDRWTAATRKGIPPHQRTGKNTRRYWTEYGQTLVSGLSFVPRLANTEDVPPHAPIPLSRRRLLRDGAAGTAALYLASHWEILDADAIGAPISPVVRRSTWTALVGVTVSAAGHALDVVAVEDLQAAAAIPALRDHDGAFVVRFSGAPGLIAGTARVTGPNGLGADLFVAPVDGRGTRQAYEAVVDRTVRIAGINDEGTPEPVGVPAVRALPAAGPAVPRIALRTPRLRSARLRRRSDRRATAELVLADTRDVVRVRASLVLGRKAVARASTHRRAPHELGLRLVARTPLRAGRYRLVVRLIAKDGAVTTVRRSVRLG